jgi:hypothetical protein
MPTKPVYPSADRFPVDTNASLRKQIFNICFTQGELMICLNRIGNDRSRKTEALEARQIETLKHNSHVPKPITVNKLAMPGISVTDT